jgi:hypothetical protein
MGWSLLLGVILILYILELIHDLRMRNRSPKPVHTIKWKSVGDERPRHMGLTTRVSIKLSEEGKGKRWLAATLTTNTPDGVAVIRRAGWCHPPASILVVRITSDCPVELLDAAVEAGYYVVGKPIDKRI